MAKKRHNALMRRPPKINAIYAGLVKNRKEVEMILQEALPARGRVEAAWITGYWVESAGGKAWHQEGVVYWSLDRCLYAGVVRRITVNGNAEPWERTVYRPRISMDIENAKAAVAAGVTQGAYCLQLAERLAELERRWWAGEAEDWDKLPELTETLGLSQPEAPKN